MPLIAGLGIACVLSLSEFTSRAERAASTKNELLTALAPLGAELNGDPDRTVPTTLNFSIPGIDSEAAIVALKDVVAVSNGSACTSQRYAPSHVLIAAGLPPKRVEEALRLSWGQMKVIFRSR